MSMLSSPGMIDEQIVLVGPDATSFSLSCVNTASVAEAKQFWSNQTSAPVEYVELARDGQVLAADASIQTGDQLSVFYNLTGSGPCGFQCSPNFKLETGFPALCALGMCCNHCWCIDCAHIGGMLKAQESCCEGFDCCCSAECGFHKIWQCELFCLQLECGSPGWAPKCGGNCFKCETGFPKFCALGMCCHHCHLNNWCCEYWAHPFGEHCAANKCICCQSTCGIAILGMAELFCLQCKCFHCAFQDPHAEGCFK